MLMCGDASTTNGRADTKLSRVEPGHINVYAINYYYYCYD